MKSRAPRTKHKINLNCSIVTIVAANRCRKGEIAEGERMKRKEERKKKKEKMVNVTQLEM